MNLSSLSGLNGVSQQQNLQRANARVQAAITGLVSGNRVTRAADDVAALSIASQLQSETAGLKQVSNNIAQALSLTQVADGGVSQIQSVLERLQQIGVQSNSPVLTDDQRGSLNQEFRQLIADIDRLVGGTTFNGAALLDGTQSLSLDGLLQSENGDGETLALNVDSLAAASLFGSASLDVLSSDASQQALNLIGVALQRVTGVRADIGSFQQTLGFAAANIDSAIINQEAARSVLSDADFAENATELSLADLQRNAGLALAAQGNRLTPSLLKLVS